MGGIRTLKFYTAQPQDLPGCFTDSSISDRRHVRTSRHEIEYVPQVRSFLVTHFNQSTKKPEYALIHESVPQNVILAPVESK